MNLVGKTTTQRQKDAMRKARYERYARRQRFRRTIKEIEQDDGPKIQPYNRIAQIEGLQKLMEHYGQTGKAMPRRTTAKFRDKLTGRTLTASEWASVLGISTDRVRVIINGGYERFGVWLERVK